MQNSSWQLRRKFIVVLAVLVAAAAILTVWLSKPTQPGKNAATHSPSAQPTSVSGASSPSSSSDPTGEARPPDAKAADTTASAVPLAGCEVVLEAADGKSEPIRLTGSDGLFDRLFIAEKTALQLTLTLPNLTVGQEILISAPNGGNLSRQDGPLSYKAKSATEKVTLHFVPSIGRGVYTIRIQHRGESQIIDLWAGSRNPLGEPGPAYVQQPVAENNP